MSWFLKIVSAFSRVAFGGRGVRWERVAEVLRTWLSARLSTLGLRKLTRHDYCVYAIIALKCM